LIRACFIAVEDAAVYFVLRIWEGLRNMP